MAMSLRFRNQGHTPKSRHLNLAYENGTQHSMWGRNLSFTQCIHNFNLKTWMEETTWETKE